MGEAPVPAARSGGKKSFGGALPRNPQCTDHGQGPVDPLARLESMDADELRARRKDLLTKAR